MATAQIANSIVWGFAIWWLYQQSPINLFGAELSLKNAVDPINSFFGLSTKSGWGLWLAGQNVVGIEAGIIAWIFWMIAAWPFYRGTSKPM